MEIKTMAPEEEKEYQAVMREYYDLLFGLKKEYNIRWHMHSDVWNGTIIEITYRASRRKKRVICSINMDSETDAMRIAIRDLQNFRDQNMNRTEPKHLLGT